jgi:hypothetical protein
MLENQSQNMFFGEEVPTGRKIQRPIGQREHYNPETAKQLTL